MAKADILPVVGGGVAGLGVGVLGDWVSNKYPQKSADGKTTYQPKDKDFSYFKDKSLLINAGVGVLGLVAMSMQRNFGISSDVALGAGVAGTVALTKAIGRVYSVMQEKDSTSGNEWANYARQRAMQQHYAYRSASLPNTQIESGLFNIK